MIQQVFAPDGMAKAILREQSGLGNEKLRWSVFLFPFDCRSGFYLYHNLTKQCFRVDRELYEAARAGKTPEDAADLASLASARFLVPETEDETALFEGLQRLLRLRTARRRLSSYTVMTTTACNARCFYCIEEGVRVLTMSPEMTEQTLAFILRTRDPGRRTHLSWFGGEPLAAPQVIERISAELTARGIDFDASIISNGVLIDEEIAAKMAGPWRIRRVQISLDGKETDYNSRKNFRYPYPSAYRRLMQALRLLMATGIQVVLRCNVDADNADGLRELIDDLARELPEKRRFYPDFAVLLAQRQSREHAELFRRCLEAKLYARDKGFPYAPHAPLHHVRFSLCRAENPYGCTLIGPDGLLYNCDAYIPGTESGNIRDGVTRPEYLQSFFMPEPVEEKCRACLFLPCCTSFTRCPGRVAQCRQVRELELLTDLRCEIERIEGGKEAADEIVDECGAGT